MEICTLKQSEMWHASHSRDACTQAEPPAFPFDPSFESPRAPGSCIFSKDRARLASRPNAAITWCSPSFVASVTANELPCRASPPPLGILHTCLSLQCQQLGRGRTLLRHWEGRTFPCPPRLLCRSHVYFPEEPRLIPRKSYHSAANGR